MKWIFLFLFSLAAVCRAGSTEERVIPRPLEQEFLDGEFLLRPGAHISAPEALANEAKGLRSALRPATGYLLPVVEPSEPAAIMLQLDPSLKSLGGEGYRLHVASDLVRISAPKPAGVFYGIQSFLQLMPAAIVSTPTVSGAEWRVPTVKITDKPRFGWRAFMLDEARHFKGEAEVKKLLDQMAALKMNVFHWHLTDDQGWRIEIKRYPKLTEIGSKRTDTQVGGWGSPKRSGEPHEGFYTQEQIRDIVAYAADRHITIVPEIGMPGHAVAAIASYPELGTTKKKIDVMTVFGKAVDVYDPSSDFTYEFLSRVLDEVVELFPSKIIHIGGDEVRFEQWQKSDAVKALMKKQKLKTMADVQIYFTNRMAKIVESKGRNIMGWNEIMGDDLHGFLKDGQTAKAGQLDPDTIVHFWKGNADLARRALAKGHRIVNSWHSYTYLDYSYGAIPLKKAYNFEPVFDGLKPSEEKAILGLGCQMWGEWIPTVERMEQQIYPRIAAYAEVGWTSRERRDYRNFTKRLGHIQKRWDELGINYAKVELMSYTAEDFFNWREVGKWSGSPDLADWTEIEMPLEGLVGQKGSYEVVFFYEQGAHALNISKVSLLEDGKPVAVDEHDGYSGWRKTGIIYRLELKDFEEGANYSLRARVKGEGGVDSNGVVKLQTVGG